MIEHEFGVPPKTRLRIVPTSCTCGGQWAWVMRRPSGAEGMRGCVCHQNIKDVVSRAWTDTFIKWLELTWTAS